MIQRKLTMLFSCLVLSRTLIFLYYPKLRLYLRIFFLSSDGEQVSIDNKNEQRIDEDNDRRQRGFD